MINSDITMLSAYDAKYMGCRQCIKRSINLMFLIVISLCIFNASASFAAQTNALNTLKKFHNNNADKGIAHQHLLGNTNETAVQLSNNDQGAVLLFPYYSVNGGFNTLFSLTNSTDHAKALRLRFREAANSREVFSVNIYLAAHDTWSAGLIKEPDTDLTTIISHDDSCTIPAINQQPVSFYQDFYTGNFADERGPERQRMHEGFFEVIEMGVVNDTMASQIENCDSIQQAWDNGGIWANNTNADISSPTGGLSATTVLINVAEGIAIAEPVTALTGFSNQPLHFDVNNSSPDLNDGTHQSIVFDQGTPLTLTWPTGYEAVSSVLSKTSIQAQYALDETIQAKTDWIISMPTRQFHIESEMVTQPFEAPVRINPNDSRQCEYINIDNIYDRDSTSALVDRPFPCGVIPPGAFCAVVHALCNTTSTTAFDLDDGDLASSIFDSHHTIFSTGLNGFLQNERNLNSPFNHGMMKIEMRQSTNNGLDNQQNNTTVNGLPLIGFSTQTYTNNNAQPGLLANYAGAFAFKSDTDIQTAVTSADEHLLNNEAKKPMQLNTQGTGQVLLYPYYTVRNDLITLITLVNTTEQIKAVSIKFRESRNARETLSFNIYLDAHDVWTAGLIATLSTIPGHIGQDSVKILTSDTTCTVPQINNQEFLPFSFANDNDGMGMDMSRATEGSIEVIELGSVIGDDADAASHVAGVPGDCQQLIGNWTAPTGQWVIDPSVNITNPDGSGGLYGSLDLIDVQTGIDYSYDATAIQYYSSAQQHKISELSPNLSTGNNFLTRTDDQVIEWNSGAEAISALLMEHNTTNDFTVNERINAQSEWVFNFPTRAFFTDPEFANSEVPIAPFTEANSENGACQSFTMMTYNRDGQNTNPNDVSACWSVNVMPVTQSGQTSDILDSDVLINAADVLFSEGWLKGIFSDNRYQLHGMGMDGKTHTIYGLPINGIMLQKYTNGTLNNGQILANYGIALRNKSTQ